VRLRNHWVTIDTRNWKTRDDMTINVGLGTGSKDAQIAHLMTVLGIQKEAIQAPQLGLVTPKNIYNTLAKLIEKIDLKSVQPYFTDPEAAGPGAPAAAAKPPVPDPRLVKVQGALQLAADKQAAQAAAAREKLQMDAALALRQQDLEAQLERERQARDADAKVQTAIVDRRVRATSNATPPVTQGGRVG